MDDTSDKSEFKIVDKRRFNAEGESHGDADSSGVSKGQTAEAETSATKVAETSRGAAKAGIAESGSVPVGSDSVASDPVGGEAIGSDEHHGPQKLDFSSFIFSLGTQAFAALGEIPNPMTKTVMTNFDAARELIDILGLLDQKTEGNLTEDEAELMSRMLLELRMTFARKVAK